MCKCCDGQNANCNCMHHKKGMWVGLLLIVVGVLWYLSSYGYITQDFWKWLLPLVIVLVGVKMMMMNGMSKGKGMSGMMHGEKHEGQMHDNQENKG